MNTILRNNVFFKLGRILRWLQNVINRHTSDKAIDLKHPLGLALKDAELLIAFAAQSFRKIDPKKVERLINIATKLESNLANEIALSSSEKAEFWIAYDDLAVDMAPLSAYSIRSSMRVNAKILTSTFFYSLLTIAVFVICIALQGFWVAGKELIERADVLEARKGEVLQKIIVTSGILTLTKNKLTTLNLKMCRLMEQGPCQDADADSTKKTKPTRKISVDIRHIAELDAERNIVENEISEKEISLKNLHAEIGNISRLSLPHKSLLQDWYNRSQVMCEYKYIRIVCPVSSEKGLDQVEQLKIKIDNLQKEVEKKKGEKSKATPPSESPLDKFNTINELTNRMNEAAELSSLKEGLQRLEEDNFHSILMVVRITVANIGTYQVAMAMGLLGALTFILRTLSTQMREHTYIPVSISVSVIRICLGAIAGVFGSLLAPSTTASITNLPPLFIPFVFGYGIEILFSLLDKVVRSFTQPEQPSNQFSSRK